MSAAILKESDHEQSVVCHWGQQRESRSACCAHEDLDESYEWHLLTNTQSVVI
jgi:hypothetical protein